MNTMRSFGSDNNSGVHPLILAAISEANINHAIGYGSDPWTEKAQQEIKLQFGENASAFFVFNGTGANVVSINACTRSFHSVICTDAAHIVCDECGAPSKASGCLFLPIQTPDGKLTPELIRPKLQGFGDQHHSQPKLVYISQCTEWGTVYTPEEIKAIADLIHPYGMYLHMDGARIHNAAAALGKTLKEITVDCGVDILSFGGTKNGMMMGEAVISFRPELTADLRFHRKQAAQLFSKMRYASCQFIPYLHDNLWLTNASHANKMAQILREGLLATGCCSLVQSPDANILLVKMSAAVSAKLLEKHFFYIWDEVNEIVRFVTSWDTTEDDIQSFLKDLNDSLSELNV